MHKNTANTPSASLFDGRVCKTCNFWLPASRFNDRHLTCYACEHRRKSDALGIPPSRQWRIDAEGRECTQCTLYKLSSEFDTGKNPGGMRECCKACRKALAVSKRIANAAKNERPYYPSIKLPPEVKRQRSSQRTCQWQRNNPEKVKAKASCRRARKKQSSGSFTASEWTELCRLYNNVCLCCGSSAKLCADHIVPLSRGGSNSISNIQPLCISCNSKKHTKTIDYRP